MPPIVTVGCVGVTEEELLEPPEKGGFDTGPMPVQKIEMDSKPRRTGRDPEIVPVDAATIEVDAIRMAPCRIPCWLIENMPGFIELRLIDSGVLVRLLDVTVNEACD